MRIFSDDYEATYRSSRVAPVWDITAWLGDEPLSDEVPIIGGTVEASATDSIPGSLSLSVQSSPEWLPTHPRHPLANKGQRLRVRKGFVNASREVADWFDLGQFRIWSSVPDGDTVEVKADSLEKIIELARFTQPVTLAASTMYATIRFLLDGILPVWIDPALPDRATRAQTWERERLEAVEEVLTAWPARGYVDETGTYVVEPIPDDDTPALTVTDEDCLIKATPNSDSDSVPNAVTASTAPDDGSTPIHETVYNTSGPLAWDGPYGQQPAFFASPLLTTRAQLTSAARTRLRSMQRRELTVSLEMLSDPRIELGDVIAAKSRAESIDIVGRVIGQSIGLTPDDEPGQITLSVLSGIVAGEEI